MEDSIQWHVFCLFPGQKEFQRQYIWLDINNVALHGNATLFSIAYCSSLWVIINWESRDELMACLAQNSCIIVSHYLLQLATRKYYFPAQLLKKYNLTSMINISDVFILHQSKHFFYLKITGIWKHLPWLNIICNQAVTLPAQNNLKYFHAFLAHLSTKCSWWAIVTGLCLSCVVRRPSCVNFFT